MCNPVLYGLRSDASNGDFLRDLSPRFIPDGSGPANIMQELETERNKNALSHNLETGSCPDLQRTLPRDSSVDICECKEERPEYVETFKL